MHAVAYFCSFKTIKFNVWKIKNGKMVLVAGTIGAVGYEMTQRFCENENYDKPSFERTES